MATEQKTKPSNKDDAFSWTPIADETRRADARQLCRIMAEVTGKPPVLWGSSIVGFGSHDYRYQSGHAGTSALAGFAPRNQHLDLYLVGGFEDRHDELVAELGPHKTGKGCLYIKTASPTLISTFYVSLSTVPRGYAVASTEQPPRTLRLGQVRRHNVVGSNCRAVRLRFGASRLRALPADEVGQTSGPVG